MSYELNREEIVLAGVFAPAIPLFFKITNGINHARIIDSKDMEATKRKEV
ncbi:hypothetical protein LR021_02055 [Candidatus Bipolaricaulota bacterium]|nr:hypothetical protein [Candidatus Bipolaricaulota bacterium]